MFGLETLILGARLVRMRSRIQVQELTALTPLAKKIEKVVGSHEDDEVLFLVVAFHVLYH